MARGSALVGFMPLLTGAPGSANALQLSFSGHYLTKILASEVGSDAPFEIVSIELDAAPEHRRAVFGFLHFKYNIADSSGRAP
jgi:hypothetical protein